MSCTDEICTDEIIHEPKIEQMNDITLSPKFEISLEIPRLSRDVVIKNLTEISKLCEYQKLWLDGDIFTIDNSWIPSVTRWSYNQSKDTIVPHIVETIECAVIYVASNYEDQTVIKDLLVSSINGLNNLIITYPSKKDQLNEMILKIEQIQIL